jgi:hypothetical protein
MDVRAQDLLNRVREIPGADNSVIVGSAVRNPYFNIPCSRVTIVTPYASLKDVWPLMGPKPAKRKVVLFGNQAVSYSFPYEGLEAVLTFSYIENGDDFGDKVINEFDFGINYLYYDGRDVVQHDNFKYDFDHAVLSLHKLNSIEKLPAVMVRYNELIAELGRHLPFKCPLLSLNHEKKVAKSLGSASKWIDANRDGAEVQWNVPIPNAPPRALELRPAAAFLQGQAPNPFEDDF